MALVEFYATEVLEFVDNWRFEDSSVMSSTLVRVGKQSELQYLYDGKFIETVTGMFHESSGTGNTTGITLQSYVKFKLDSKGYNILVDNPNNSIAFYGDLDGYSGSHIFYFDFISKGVTLGTVEKSFSMSGNYSISIPFSIISKISLDDFTVIVRAERKQTGTTVKMSWYPALLEFKIVADAISEVSEFPPTITNLTPANGATTNLLQPTFTAFVEESEGNKVGLIIEYSQDQSFSTYNSIQSTQLVNAGQNISLTPTSMLSSGTWYWRAKAYDSILESSYTEVRTLIIMNNTPDEPSNLSPNDNVEISANNVDFSGIISDIDAGLVKLDIEISESQDFSIINFTKSSDYVASGSLASVNMSGLTWDKLYYWRARTFDGERFSTYSQPRRFTIKNATPTMSDYLPVSQTRYTNGSNINFSVKISDLDGDFSKARFEYTTDSTFTTYSARETEYLSSGSVHTIKTLESKLNNGIWYWRVKATDRQGRVSGYSNTFVMYIEEPITTRFEPDQILQATNFSGSVSDLKDADNKLIVPQTSNVSGVLRVGFPTPPFQLETGENKQIFGVYARNTNTAVFPTLKIGLYENGVLKAESATYSVSSNITNGSLFTFYWNASLVSNLDGSLVECQVNTTPIKSGKNVGDIEIASIYWDAFHKTNAGSVIIDNNNPPIPEIVSISRTKISSISGVDRVTVIFKFDIDIDQWSVNVGGSSSGTGYIVDQEISSTIIPAGTELTTVIDYTEGLVEGANRVNIYGRNPKSYLWTPYDNTGGVNQNPKGDTPY